MESFKPLIAKVAAGASLTRTEAESAFDSMLSGEVTPSQMGGFLMALQGARERPSRRSRARSRRCAPRCSA